jgi:dihydrofolate reductase
MKTILIFVSTLDGKVTRWGNPDIRSWSSRGDQDYFDSVLNHVRVIIMGSGTYNPDPVIPVAKHLYIVMTRTTDKYSNKEVPGQLEFTSEAPMEIVRRFRDEGEKQVLVVGGPRLATSFLKDNLIDELWLTLEPRLFGTGDSIVTEEKLDVSLNLLSSDKINEQGTLINKYRIIHEN